MSRAQATWILLLTTCLGAAPARAELVGSWSFEEASGTSAGDASPFGNHGSVLGGPARVAGRTGSALELDGADDRVSVPDAPSLRPASALTLAAWIRPRRAATQYLIKKARQGALDGYELSLSSGGQVFVRLHQASAGDAFKLTSQRAYPIDGATWLHVAASFDGAALRLYLDGVLEGTLATPGLGLASNDLPLALGSEPDGSRPFQGGLDEVRVFDHALSQAEIQALRSEAPPGGDDDEQDEDADGDGVPDDEDDFPFDPSEWSDSDGDGVGDEEDLDDDGDDLPDGWELANGLDPLDPDDASGDADGDGLDNLGEFLAGSDPLDPAVARWSFEEGSGALAADASGHGFSGSLAGAPTWIPGLVGGALHFRGVSGSGICRLGGGTSLRFDSKRVEWKITNTASARETLVRVQAAWPSANGKLRKIFLDGTTIYETSKSPPSANISSGWKGSSSARWINAGQTRTLKLEFEKNAVRTASAYALEGELSGGCRPSFPTVVDPPVGDRVVVPDHPALDASSALTLVAWVRPERVGWQTLLRKGRHGISDGYELSLSDAGRVVVRLDQASSGDAHLLASASAYPTDGQSWIHVAASYDGAEIRLYVNGVLEGTRSAPGLAVGPNPHALSLGAQDDGLFPFAGALDEVALYDSALEESDVRRLVHAVRPPPLDTWLASGLAPLPTSAGTADKPQSKLWSFGGSVWGVFADDRGTWLRRLDADRWTRILELSPSAAVRADCLVNPASGLAHVLLFEPGGTSWLASLEPVAGFPGSYRAWSARPDPALVPVSSAAESASLALDGRGDLWVAYDTANAIELRTATASDAYRSFSGAIEVASGVTLDDLAGLTAFDGKIGVLWSDQNTRRFGFRFHRDGDAPTAWSADEAPGAAGALALGAGLADDHVSLATSSDGTIFAAVKTGYDTPGVVRVGLLVRRPSGSWEPLHEVDAQGTRPIVMLNEALGTLLLAYVEHEHGGAIFSRASSTGLISFGPRQTLIAGTDLNNPSSAKHPFRDELVVVATRGGTGGQVVGVALAAE